MAFIGLLVANVVLLVLICGLLTLFLGIILDIIWFIRSRMKKKTHIIVKVFAVVTTIGGFFTFVVPIVSVSLLGNMQRAKTEKEFNSIENKVYINDYSDMENGFTFNGKEFVKADFLHRQPDAVNMDMVGAIVFDGEEERNEYHAILPIQNDNHYEIYEIERYSPVYCPKDQYEEIRNFYFYEDDLDTVLTIFGDEDLQKEKCEFDRETLYEIRDYYNTHEIDVEVEADSIDSQFSIQVNSHDSLFYWDIYLCTKDEMVFLEKSLGGNTRSGMKLDDDKAAYVLQQVGKYLE